MKNHPLKLLICIFHSKSNWYFVEFFNGRFILSVIIKFIGWYYWFVCRWSELIQWDSWGWECSVTVMALSLVNPSEPPVHHPFIIVRSESPTNSHTHIQPSCTQEFYKSIYWVNSLIQWSWFVHTLYFYYFFVNAANDACLHMVYMYKRNANFFSLENLWVRFMM